MISKRWAGVLVLWAMVQSGRVQAEDKPARASAAPYVHFVVFHLKKDAPQGEEDALIADAHKMLGRIRAVRGLWVGRPAEVATPRFARKFDVGLLVLLDSGTALKKYLEDPAHQAFAKKHHPYVDEERLSVFDFSNQNGKPTK